MPDRPAVRANLYFALRTHLDEVDEFCERLGLSRAEGFWLAVRLVTSELDPVRRAMGRPHAAIAVRAQRLLRRARGAEDEAELEAILRDLREAEAALGLRGPGRRANDS